MHNFVYRGKPSFTFQMKQLQKRRIHPLIDIRKGDNVTLPGVTFMALCFHLQQKQLSLLATITGIHFAYFIMMVISGWVWNWSNSGTFPLVANDTQRDWGQRVTNGLLINRIFENTYLHFGSPMATKPHNQLYDNVTLFWICLVEIKVEKSYKLISCDV